MGDLDFQDFPETNPSNTGQENRSPEKRSGSVLTAVLIVVLLAVMGTVFGFALYMAIANRPVVFRLDPYLDLVIEGADGFAEASGRFDREGFEQELEEKMAASAEGLSEAEIRELAAAAAADVRFDIEVERGAHALENLPEEDPAGTQRGDAPEAPENAGSGTGSGGAALRRTGIFNGDSVALRAVVGEETQSLLRDRGFCFVFECDPLTRTAEGLPEAAAYDPFEDLSVDFSGISGAGEVSVRYSGEYPLAFDAEPAQGLENGDTVLVRASFADGMTPDRFAEKYQVIPTRMENTYTAAGLYFYPSSAGDFSDSMVWKISENGWEAARIHLEEEYREDETFEIIEEEGLYIAIADHTDCALAVYRVGYANASGDTLEYYYYVRFDDLMVNDREDVIADFARSDAPQKPSFLFGEWFGDGAEVSVPGFLGLPGLRTLAGYETFEQLRERVIAPLEEEYTVTSLY
ncbi:MAG: hypothetical protein Q4D81_04770 [Eubacteriales bacterium]|nr:hypothetical protein [Eubacteriales bacterium]